MEPPEPPAPRRTKGRAAHLEDHGARAGPAVRVRCLFLDRVGAGWAERAATLDCRPARFVRLELAPSIRHGMVRRTWLDLGTDRAGRAIYAEQAPEPWQDPALPFKRKKPGEEWPE